MNAKYTGTLGRDGQVFVDGPKNTFDDDVKERATPQAVHSVESQSVKGHEFVITDRAGRGRRVRLREEGRGRAKIKAEGRTELTTLVALFRVLVGADVSHTNMLTPGKAERQDTFGRNQGRRSCIWVWTSRLLHFQSCERK